jgi:hypothetical protein
VAADVATGTLIVGAALATTGLVVALVAPGDPKAVAFDPLRSSWTF